jgi:hypothetical protein
LADFQNLILKAQLDAVPSTADERFAANTGEIDARSKLRTRSFGAKWASATIFLEKLRNECETSGSRNLDRQEDEALVAGCPIVV